MRWKDAGSDLSAPPSPAALQRSRSCVVDCEVLEVDEPSLLRYSWAETGGGAVTEVAC